MKIFRKQLSFAKKLFIICCLLLGIFRIDADSTYVTREAILEMVEFSRKLAQIGILQGDEYTPEDEKYSVTWDSSGTVQYYYKRFFSKSLPRDSFAQYKFLQKKGVWIPASLDENNEVDIDVLEKNLKKGDLLFWSNTHNDIPANRFPPVSHVMIYVGKSKSGNWLMVGSGTKGMGETTTRGGVDIYIFDPNRIMGCVRSETGECIENSQFLGNGRLK